MWNLGHDGSSTVLVWTRQGLSGAGVYVCDDSMPHHLAHAFCKYLDISLCTLTGVCRLA